jgi:hypothetical protein
LFMPTFRTHKGHYCDSVATLTGTSVLPSTILTGCSFASAPQISHSIMPSQSDAGAQDRERARLPAVRLNHCPASLANGPCLGPVAHTKNEPLALTKGLIALLGS